MSVCRWHEFVPALDRKNIALAPWCERIACEERVKEQTKATGEVKVEEAAAEGEGEEADAALGPRGLTGAAKTLCIPFEQVRHCSSSMSSTVMAGEPHLFYFNKLYAQAVAFSCHGLGLAQAAMPAGQKCFCCDEPASAWALWGRSY